MKTHIFCSFLLLITFFQGCNSVSNKYSVSLHDLKRNGYENGSLQYEKNDSIINVQKSTYGYEIEKFRKNQQNIKKKYLYDKKGKLLEESTFFRLLPINYQKIYDENGKVILINDYSRPEYKFTLTKVIEMVNDYFKFDAYNQTPIEIIPYTSQRYNQKSYYWIVAIKGAIFYINGENGELLLKH